MISETKILKIIDKCIAPPIKIQEILDEIITDAFNDDPQTFELFDEPMQTREIGGFGGTTATVFVRGAKRILLCTGENAADAARNLRAEIYATLAAEICKPLWVMRAVKDEEGKTVWRRMPFEPVVSIEPIASPDIRLACDPAIMTQQVSQNKILSAIEDATKRLKKDVEQAQADLDTAQSAEELEFYAQQLKIQTDIYAEKAAQNQKTIATIEKLNEKKFWLSRRSGRSWRVSFYDPQRGKRRQVSCGDLVIFYNNATADDPTPFVNACRRFLLAPRVTRARTDVLHFDQRDAGFIGCFTGIGGKRGHETECDYMVRRIDWERTRSRQTP